MTVAIQQQRNIFDRAVVLSLSLSRPGNRRKVSKALIKKATANGHVSSDITSDDAPITVNGDLKMLHVAQDLIDSPELKAIEKHDGEIRRYVQGLALPSPLGGGKYLLPIALVELVDGRLGELFNARHDLIRIAVDVYPTRKAEAEARKGPLFNELDYPPVRRYESAFGMYWQYFVFSPAASLEGISANLFHRENEKFQTQMVQAQQEISDLLRVAAKECVDHMVERLTPGEDGKPKTFRNSLVQNLLDFMSTFDARNIADDQELGELMTKVRELMKGVTPDTLRDSTAIRSYVLNGVQKVKEQLDGLVVTRTARAVAFEDEDAA